MSIDVARSSRIFGIVPQSWVTPLTVSVFAVIGVSGLMLFFGLLEGLVKEMHEWLGVAFVAVAILHLAKNWRPFTLMMRKPVMAGSVAAVAIAASVFIGGTLLGGGGGENPMRAIAQAVETAPIETSAALFGLSREELFARLREAGIEPAADARSLSEIAQKSGADARRVLGAIVTPSAE